MGPQGPAKRGTAQLTAKRFIEAALIALPSLLRVGRRLTRDDAEAEDLVQDTLVRALEKRTELRDQARMKPWLLAVQRTVFLNSRRGLRQRFEVLDGGLSPDRVEPVGDLEQELLDQSLDDRLVRSMEALPELWREALWLREVEGLSYEEIAQVQDCPVGTVRSRLARARQAMLEGLEKEKHDDLMQR
jgi:RNA polymerase sigma-70 factor, ECF subfamily